MCKRLHLLIYSFLLATPGITSASMGPESIKVTPTNSEEYGFIIVKESGGVADEVVITVAGPKTDQHGCEFKSVGTATMDAKNTQVSVFLSYAQPSGGIPKVLFSPNAKLGYYQVAWFQYGCKNRAYRYEITI